MFKKAKVNDKVWAVDYGWGVITDITTYNDYPITVHFKDVDEYCTYTLEGKLYVSSKNPLLFWDEIKFEIPPRPKRKVKKWISLFLNNDGVYQLKTSHADYETPVFYDSLEEAMSNTMPNLKYQHYEIETLE